jgi:hypothetical protein
VKKKKCVRIDDNTNFLKITNNNKLSNPYKLRRLFNDYSKFSRSMHNSVIIEILLGTLSNDLYLRKTWLYTILFTIYYQNHYSLSISQPTVDSHIAMLFRSTIQSTIISHIVMLFRSTIQSTNDSRIVMLNRSTIQSTIISRVELVMLFRSTIPSTIRSLAS